MISASIFFHSLKGITTRPSVAASIRIGLELYLAAWIYLWELDNPNDPIGFVLRKWNPSSGRLNPKAPFASKYYAPGWKKSGPRLLEKWRQKDRSYNR